MQNLLNAIVEHCEFAKCLIKKKNYKEDVQNFFKTYRILYLRFVPN